MKPETQTPLGLTQEAVVIVDSREQRPLTFAHLPSEIATLDVADYSVRGLEHRIGCDTSR